tara:strand:+ start:343 stop:1419 length:1077 start_codon:yes stop_codon:yes gene_type:complete
MSEELIYAFTKDDIKDVINFCKNYHLEETKKGAGRTGSGPRGFGGEIDAFGPGKLREIGISKIISKLSGKECFIDNEIYSNYKVGQNVNADIIKVKENNIERDPKLYIEIKPFFQNDEWYGMRADQIESIERKHTDKLDNTYLIYGEILYDDNKNKKERDFLGAFLKSVLVNENYSFEEFSNVGDIKCKIHYAFSLKDLKSLGHLYPKQTIIPETRFRLAKQIFNKDGQLWKGKKKLKDISSKKNIEAYTLPSGKILEYGKFKFDGKAILIGDNKNKKKQYLFFENNSVLESEYFGTFKYKKGEAISFNIRNKLEGFQGSSLKGIDDWWISKNRLDQLIFEKKIDKIDIIIKNIATNI